MEDAAHKRKFHFEKGYMRNPLKIGDVLLVQIGRTHCSKDYAVGDHAHLNWFELTCVTGGSGKILTNGVTAQVNSGDLYLSFPGDIHAICSDNDNPLKFDFLSVWPLDERIKAQLEEIMVQNNSPHNRTFTDVNIKNLIGNSISEVILNDTFSEEMLALAFNQILRYLIRDFSTEDKAQKSSRSAHPKNCAIRL